jgi:hypothetical protein
MRRLGWSFGQSVGVEADVVDLDEDIEAQTEGLSGAHEFGAADPAAVHEGAVYRCEVENEETVVVVVAAGVVTADLNECGHARDVSEQRRVASDLQTFRRYRHALTEKA